MYKNSTNERFSNREFQRMERLIKEKKAVREIARLLDRSPSSVSRHLNNPDNLDEFRVWKKWIKRFSAEFAIVNQEKGRKGRGAKPKVGKDEKLRKYLEECIKKKKWSPKIALGYAKKKGLKFEQSVSVKTIYRSIYNGHLNVSLFDLHLKLQRKPNRERITRVWKRIFGKRIDERPDISDRKEFGHWEIDTVLWGRRCSVLVLVERKSRYCKILKLESHTAEEVNAKLKESGITVKTITADNGSEFAKLLELFEETYFTHPYSSWEKGSVENLNGLIRRYLPRTTQPDKITQLRLDEVACHINNLPRPILDYHTAQELYSLNAS